MIEYTKGGKQIKIFFLSEKDVESRNYRNFLDSEEFRTFKHASKSDDLYKIHTERMQYYKSLYDQKTVCASVDGKIVGQSCALKHYAIVKGRRVEWWWSVDTFLMSACRGLGIGKALQKLLHDELPNFSSAWYTPINGIVKQKCGAHGIADVWFNYYPVSSLVTMFIDLSFRKLFNKAWPLRFGIPFLYARLNSIFTDTKLKSYKVIDVPYTAMGNSEADFMEASLSVKDFHIERSVDFLRWRYSNLKAPYHMLRLERNRMIEAIVSFTEPYSSKFDVCPIKGVTICDLVISPNSKLTERQVFLFVTRWLRQHGMKCDGIQMLESITYLGKIFYPFHACPILTTLEGYYPNSYLTFIDQDLYQI